MSSRVRRVNPPVDRAVVLALYFESLANPTRMRIVEHLVHHAEVRVSELATQCKVSQPRASWHLRALERAGVIISRRDGREVFCRLDRESIHQQLNGFAQFLSLGGPVVGSSSSTDNDKGE